MASEREAASAPHVTTDGLVLHHLLKDVTIMDRGIGHRIAPNEFVLLIDVPMILIPKVTDPDRHLMQAVNYRILQGFQVWQEAVCA